MQVNIFDLNEWELFLRSLQSAVVSELERWPHTPVSVDSIPLRRKIAFLNLLTTMRKYLYVMKKGVGTESKIISRSF